MGRIARVWEKRIFEVKPPKSKRKSPENQGFSGLGGGDKRERTADLLNAIQALSQLSYTPKFRPRLQTATVLYPWQWVLSRGNLHF